MNTIFYTKDIEQDTNNNTNFRSVVWTGKHMQIVYMSLRVGEEIGIETHNYVDQFFRIEQGTGVVMIDGESFEMHSDSAIVVPAGSEHDVINTGSVELKLYTIYTPANHIDGTVHVTKADAENDTSDEDFGHSQDSK